MVDQNQTTNHNDNVCLRVDKKYRFYAQFLKWFKHSIDVCLNFLVDLPTMAKIYVVKHSVSHMVSVEDVKMDLGDAKYKFENNYIYE